VKRQKIKSWRVKWKEKGKKGNKGVVVEKENREIGGR